MIGMKRLKFNIKRLIMRVVVSTLSILVGMGWSIGYFKFEEGGSFHLTLVVAVFTLIMQWLPSSKP